MNKLELYSPFPSERNESVARSLIKGVLSRLLMRLHLFLSSTSPCVDGGIVTSDESHTSDPTQMIDFSNIQAERQQASSNHHHIKSNTVPS